MWRNVTTGDQKDMKTRDVIYGRPLRRMYLFAHRVYAFPLGSFSHRNLGLLYHRSHIAVTRSIKSIFCEWKMRNIFFSLNAAFRVKLTFNRIEDKWIINPPISAVLSNRNRTSLSWLACKETITKLQKIRFWQAHTL